MPRPGPRPYECVRRAWHSDRHQPMRGSIIQQIFRVVTEAHSSTTRKNREWQEKLPRVVFKAEEIMYSKANSEAEYMDPETLWERLNDAIDTIIRRDESTETGQFLQPCIEAALVLGCVPVRASRSQRHSNPRSYLNPRFHEPVQAAPATADNTNNHRPPSQPLTSSSNQLTVSRSIIAYQANTTSPFNSQAAANNNHIGTYPGPHLQSNLPRPMASPTNNCNTSLDFGSVYPLYYGNYYQNIESHRLQPPKNPNPNNYIVGTPVGWPARQLPCYVSTRNLLPDQSAVIPADELRQVKPADIHGHAAENVCDLSLRLGPSDPCTSVEKELAHETRDGGSSIRQESSKHMEPYAENHEFCFLPRHNAASDPSELCNNTLEQEGEFQDKYATSRKRNAPEPHESEDGRIQWLMDPQPNRVFGQNRWPGPTIL